MIEFYQKKLKEWQEVSHQASIEGNFEKWQKAQREIETYEQMLRRADVQTNGDEK